MSGYSLEIYGYLWQGCRGVYVYPLPAAITTDAEAIGAAHDFMYVLDWRLVKRWSTAHKKGRTYHRCNYERTLRGFRNGMSPRRFNRLAYGY